MRHFKIYDDFLDAVGFISSLCDGKDAAPSAREVRKLLHDPAIAARFIRATTAIHPDLVGEATYAGLASLLLGSWHFYMRWAASVVALGGFAGEEDDPDDPLHGASHLLAGYPHRDAEVRYEGGGFMGVIPYRRRMLDATPPAFKVVEGMEAEFLALGRVAEGWAPDLEASIAIGNAIMDAMHRERGYPLTFKACQQICAEAPWAALSVHTRRVARHIILPWLKEHAPTPPAT